MKSNRMETVRPSNNTMICCLNTDNDKIIASAVSVDASFVLVICRHPEPYTDDEYFGAFTVTKSDVRKQLEKEKELIHGFRERDIGYKMVGLEDMYYFDELVSTILQKIKSEQKLGNNVYVYIKGTEEYSAAATVASMMCKNVVLFTTVGMPFGLNSKGYGIFTERGEVRLKNDIDIMTLGIDYFPMDEPDMFLMKRLQTFGNIPLTERSNSRAIREFIKAGLWKYPDEMTGDYAKDIGGTSYELEMSPGFNKYSKEYKRRKNLEAVQYQRRFIEPNVDKWIYKNVDTGGWYELTEKAERYVAIFCRRESDADNMFFKADGTKMPIEREDDE